MASSTRRPSRRVKAMSAATDNVGLFFGEDIFIAIASILLIQGSLASFGIQLTPFQLSVWAIPSAICAFLIHGARLLLLDRQLRARPMINLHWLYVLRRRGVRGFRAWQRVATRPTRSAGATRPSGGCSRSASGSAISSATSATACWCSRSSRSPGFTCSAAGSKASTTGRRARELLRALRQQAVPAGADHPVHRVRRDARCSTTRRSRTAG